MKKVILTFAFLSMLMAGGNVFAQNEAVDGFFNSAPEAHRVDDPGFGKMPILPTQHGSEKDFTSVPVGSGLLLLGAMSVGYLAIRKRD